MNTHGTAHARGGGETGPQIITPRTVGVGTLCLSYHFSEVFGVESEHEDVVLLAFVLDSIVADAQHRQR